MEFNKSHWVWMPHGGHFCLANRCCFRLNTYVNGYIVSTVGEVQKEIDFLKLSTMSGPIGISRVNELLTPSSTDDYVLSEAPEEYVEHLKRFLCMGMDGFYETMIFDAIPNESSTFSCCPYQINVQSNYWCQRYYDPVSAHKGHIEMCHECDKEFPKFLEEDDEEDDE